MSTHKNNVNACCFDRSYVRWRVDTTKQPAITVSQKLPMTVNNVRCPIESRVLITNKKTQHCDQYVLTASCKTEQVWVAKDIWHQPNADFSMIANKDQCLLLKHWDKVDKGVMRYPASLGVQPERQVDSPSQLFDRFAIEVEMQDGYVIETIDDVIDVLSSSLPIVAYTEYEMGGYQILIEYPVKAVNFSERERFYQVDTGPVLVPDFSNDTNHMIEKFNTAYIAHCGADWAEFIVNVPTPLTEEIQVHHYSQPYRIENVANRLVTFDE